MSKKTKSQNGKRELSDSVVLITGALTGIGRAAALAFADEGSTVVIAGRREEAEKLALTWENNPYQQALVYAGLGDKDRTFEALNRLAALGPVRVGRSLTYPEMALVRGDPRLKVLRKKAGLPE